MGCGGGTFGNTLRNCQRESRWGGEGAAYHVGCIGLRSTPTTCAEGNISPMSNAQMPVPVPQSRMLCGSRVSGAAYRLPRRERNWRWW